jgi:5-methylcytosine-specific restriction endonuclease McrA
MCQLCPSVEGLEFDHIDKATKLFTLSGAGLDKAWQKILDELAKCQLLCSECHKIKTSIMVDHIGGHNKILEQDLLHGTARMYTLKGCRCSMCRLAKKRYRNKEILINELAS